MSKLPSVSLTEHPPTFSIESPKVPVSLKFSFSRAYPVQERTNIIATMPKILYFIYFKKIFIFMNR